MAAQVIGRVANGDSGPDHDEIETNGGLHMNETEPELQEDTSSKKRAHDRAGLLPDNAPDTLPAGRCWMAFLVVVAALGGFLFGYDTGVVSGAMLQIKSPKALGPLSAGFQEAVVSSTIAGAVVGAVAATGLNDRLGRKGVLLLGTACFTGGAAVMAAAPDVITLIVGRAIVGLAVGVASHTSPLYLSELAPKAARGSITAANNVFICLGQVIASGTCCMIAHNGDPAGWRWMLGLAAVPSVAMFSGLLCLPESPAWTLRHRGPDAASRILVPLRGTKEAEIELQELLHEAQSGTADKAQAWSAMKRRGVRRALALGCFVQLLQQTVGINTIMYYSATILEMADSESAGDCSGAGELDTDSAVREICLSAPVATSQLIGGSLGMVVIDRAGRRSLVLVSLAGVVLALCSLGAAFSPMVQLQGAVAAWLPVVSMVCYLICFGLGMGPVPWTLNAEIYPFECRALCVSAATMCNWVANVLVAATFLDLSRALSTSETCPYAHPDGAFWMYACVGVVGWLVLAFGLPETKGKSIQEIQDLFEAGSHPTGAE
mmetsp:Transcript_49712/g.131141  ORF Transcript_49712/g.131141 Transcript_49712/m.131141 type:complete len:548 (-) Transcript_49712:191-1834(-)